MRINLSILIPTLFIGLFFIIWTIVDLIKDSKLKKKCTATTTGIVEGKYSVFNNTDEPLKNYVIIRYKTPKGTFSPKVAMSPKSIGQKLTIKYNPQAHEEFYIVSNPKIVALDITIPIILGVFAIVIGLIFALK